MITADFQSHLVRAEVWTEQLKEALLPSLKAMPFVDWMPDFGADQLNVPSLGQASTFDMVEDEAVSFEKLDTGEWTFVIDQYVGSAHYITEKAIQNSFYGSQMQAEFLDKEMYAIQEHVEANILNLGQKQQTLNDANLINNIAHRRIGGGTVNSVTAIDLNDFALMKLAFDRAQVPPEGRIAVVDPTVIHTIQTLTGVQTITNFNQFWSDQLFDPMNTNDGFEMNLYGWTILSSNYLPTVATELSGVAGSGGALKANLFFSMNPRSMSFKGMIRQAPKVDYQFKMERQRHEYLTTMRYGTDVFRPESVGVVITSDLAFA